MKTGVNLSYRSLNYTRNEKYFRQKCIENQNTNFMLKKLFPRIVTFTEKCRKHGTADQATDDDTLPHRSTAICVPDD